MNAVTRTTMQNASMMEVTVLVAEIVETLSTYFDFIELSNLLFQFVFLNGQGMVNATGKITI